jgi:hypothetical protein
MPYAASSACNCRRARNPATHTNCSTGLVSGIPNNSLTRPSGQASSWVSSVANLLLNIP